MELECEVPQVTTLCSDVVVHMLQFYRYLLFSKTLIFKMYTGAKRPSRWDNMGFYLKEGKGEEEVNSENQTSCRSRSRSSSSSSSRERSWKRGNGSGQRRMLKHSAVQEESPPPLQSGSVKLGDSRVEDKESVPGNSVGISKSKRKKNRGKRRGGKKENINLSPSTLQKDYHSLQKVSKNIISSKTDEIRSLNKTIGDLEETINLQEAQMAKINDLFELKIDKLKEKFEMEKDEMKAKYEAEYEQFEIEKDEMKAKYEAEFESKRDKLKVKYELKKVPKTTIVDSKLGEEIRNLKQIIGNLQNTIKLHESENVSMKEKFELEKTELKSEFESEKEKLKEEFEKEKINFKVTNVKREVDGTSDMKLVGMEVAREKSLVKIEPGVFQQEDYSSLQRQLNASETRYAQLSKKYNQKKDLVSMREKELEAQKFVLSNRDKEIKFLKDEVSDLKKFLSKEAEDGIEMLN